MSYLRLARCMIFACALPLLLSCAAPERRVGTKADVKLDPSSDRGAIVFGFAIDKPRTTATSYQLRWTCYNPTARTICPERDPNSERNTFGVPQRLNIWGASRQVGTFDSAEPLKEMQYFVAIMPPGNYILDQFITDGTNAPRTQVTVFADRAKTSAVSVAPRFSLDAGKMLYVGDYTIDASRFPAGISVTRNEAAARAALAEYPNIKVEMAPAALRTTN